MRYSLKDLVRDCLKISGSWLRILRVIFERGLTAQNKKLKIRVLMKFATSRRRFGKYLPYQSFPELNMHGQRNTEKRLQTYPFAYLRDGMSVLDVGCNMGCFTISLANNERYSSSKFLGIDVDQEMVSVASQLLPLNSNKNVTFLNKKLEDFVYDVKGLKFDFILCLAVDFWVNSDFSIFMQNILKLSKNETLVLIESNNLEFESVSNRWAEIKNRLTHERRILESGLTGDDVKREWILFTSKT